MRETVGKLSANDTAGVFSKELTAVFSGVFMCSASAFFPFNSKERVHLKNMANLPVPVQSTAPDPSSLQTFKVKYLKEAQHSCFVSPATGPDVWRSLQRQAFGLERRVYNTPLRLISAVLQLLSALRNTNRRSINTGVKTSAFQTTGEPLGDCHPGWYKYSLFEGNWMNGTAFAEV